MNKQCLIEYVFWRYELISARFHLLDNYTDNNYYISDYLKIKNYLETRLGQPVNDRVVWFDPTYQNKNEYWGKALGAGQLEFRSSWDMGDTELDLILTGSDNKVAFVAECLGKKYKSSFLIEPPLPPFNPSFLCPFSGRKRGIYFWGKIRLSLFLSKIQTDFIPAQPLAMEHQFFGSLD